MLVAQIFSQWLDDMHKSGMSDMSSDDGLCEELSRFRRGILCSAALHTQSRVDGGGQGGYLRFELKEWRRYPKLCKGVFSLQEFLRVACKTGNGLPFGVPHNKAKGGGKNSDYTYSKFKSKLNRIRELFPVDDVERLEKFETCHLEWLAVFLSVSDLRPRPSRTETTEQEHVRAEKAPFNSTRIAVQNICSQLGIPSSVSDSNPFFSRFLTCFPLFKTGLDRIFWRNRNILEASLHIDNMLALSAGAQYQFMSDKKRETSKQISDAMDGLGISDFNELYGTGEYSPV